MKRFLILAASAKATAEMLLYGYLHGEVSMMIVKQIQDAAKDGYKNLNLRINSKGGDPFEGLAIYNAIKRSTLKVDGYIDGLAASAASVVPLACDKVYMAKNAKLMIHQAKFWGEGQSDDLKRMSEIMDQLNGEIADIYALKTGKNKEWVLENWMAHGKDTWFSAQEALDAGLIDEIVPGVVKQHSEHDLARLAACFDDELNANFSNQNKPNMKLKAIFTAIMAIKLDGAPVVSMSANYSDEDTAIGEIQNAVTELGAKFLEMNTQLTQANKDLAAEKAKVAQMEDDSKKDKAENLVTLAIGQGKIVEGEKESYISLATANYDEVKKILDAKEAHVPVSQRINQGKETGAQDLLKLSWDEADKAGKLETIKANHLDHFKQLFKDKYGTEYKG